MNTLSVIVGIFAIGAIIFTWYITQPFVWAIIDHAETMTITLNANRTSSANMYTVLRYLNDIWGPILTVAIIAWMIISAQREDYRSAYET